MPNIISQEINSSGANITSNTGSFSITFNEIRDRYIGESGPPVVRIARVIIWLRQQLETQLDSRLVKASNFDIDFNTETGRISRLKING